MDFKNLCCELNSLSVFRNILSDVVINKFYIFISDKNSDTETKVRKYSDFISELYKGTDNFSKYILNLVLYDENIYIVEKSRKQNMGLEMEHALKNDLKVLQKISRITSLNLKETIDFKGFLPDYFTEEIDFQKIYFERLSNLKKYGYGIFAKYHAFCIDDGNLIPVKNPDPTKLEDLKGYEKERNKVISNTKALLEGKPCSNVLLYGDSGTGKSSTVKGIINEFKDKGLRLVEVKKRQLHQLPKILEKLNDNPLKFIIFLDDLSFTKNDDDFAALKAILEGSVSSSSNVAVYVTSNRRHLIKESFSDRSGDDIHLSDTMEELTSLSERFGLRLTFYKPDKDTYIKILKNLAKKYEIKTPIDEVISQGEIYAINRSGRTPRVARQFIELLKASE